MASSEAREILKALAMTTLTSPHDLLAAVPFLVGYHPANSLVLISLLDERIGLAMRIDFPEEVDPDQIDSLASHLVREKSDGALIVAYLPDSISESDYLLTPLQEAIELRGVPIRECLEIKKGYWRSLLCADPECCPPSGNQLPELSESRIVAEQVVKGRRLPYKDLDELRSSLTSFKSDPVLNKKLRAVPEIYYDSHDVRACQRNGAVAVTTLLAQFQAHGQSEDKDLIALVLARLQDLQVRDYAMGITTSENIDALQSMWHWLMRVAPKGYIAPAATLFAALAYENGDGALAGRALDRAFEDDLTYSLAKLLRRVFAAGWPPESFTKMRGELHPKICAAIFGE